MEIRSTVTSFLQYKQRILILRRSKEVKQYKGKWAGVSGLVEVGEKKKHDERAYLEIEEETGLKKSDVELVRRGRIIEIKDKEILWRVSPYLFIVKKPKKIRINWEHTDFKWIIPNQISKYNTVPGLIETLRRVYIHPEIESQIRSLRNEKREGASWIARKAVTILKTAVEKSTTMKRPVLWEELQTVGRTLIQTHPSMAPLTSGIARTLYLLYNELRKGTTPSHAKRLLIELVQNYQETSKKSLDKIAHLAKQEIKRKGMILTHTYSETVLKVLSAIGEQVFITESRPLCEGTYLAEKLAKHVNVTLITDAEAGHFLPGLDCIVIGADSILADGSVINKMGTRLLTVAAKYFRVPVYVVAESHKFSLPSFLGEDVPLEENDPKEVISRRLKNVKIRNIYFDVTPADCITAYITELGVVYPHDVQSKLEKMVKWVKVLDKDL